MMMDITGGIATVTDLAGNCLNIIDRIQVTLEYYKSISASLETIGKDISNVQGLVKAIHDDETLGQDASIRPAVQSLHDAVNELDEFISQVAKATENGKGFRLFKHGLLNKSVEQEKLARLQHALMQAKETFIAGLQLSSIGFTRRKVNNEIVLNLSEMDRIDRLIRTETGNQEGLKSLGYLKNKGLNDIPANHQYMRPSKETLSDLIGPPGSDEFISASSKFPRVEIIDNKTKDNATMISGFIGTSSDNDNDFIREENVLIRGNEASGNSLMVNRNISRNTFTYMQTTRPEPV